VVDKAQPKTREQLREALSQVKDFDGATGKTTFNAEREAEKQLFLLTIDQSGVKELDPTQKPGSKVGG
jgi:ABC-type branched-subunit amino acid transport system substrate-binding protein